jgi:hypothetical protein
LKTAQTTREQHPLQYGFTKDMSPMMAALMCTEAIAEAMDNKQPIYLAALDSQKAFDVVDHSSLKVKLYNQCPSPELWKTETQLLEGLSGLVRIKGEFSRTFNLHQGVGQGKVLSPPQYKVYLDDALCQLTEANIGAFIGHIPISVPTCADDMLLLSNYRHELQSQFHTASGYSCRERYIIHPVKTEVTAYNIKGGETDTWSLGDSELKLSDSILHLGITRQKGQAYIDSIVEDRVTAARRALYSLLGAGVHGTNGLPPKVTRVIYTLYVLPVLLHGVETLTLNKTQRDTLEQFHRDSIKNLQTLPTRVANCISYLLYGVAPLEAFIDRRIATLVGRIANQKDSTLHAVLTRQMAVKSTNSKSWAIYAAGRLAQYDFPTIPQILASPPPMSRWKMRVREVVRRYWDDRLQEEATTKVTLINVNAAGCSVSKPHRIWEHQQDDPRFTARTLTKARLLTGCYILEAHRQRFNQYRVPGTCPMCGDGDEDMLHFIRQCAAFKDLRDTLDGYLSIHHPQFDQMDEVNKMRITLDSTHNDIPRETIPVIERATTNYVYRLHTRRKQQMNLRL